MRIASIAGIVGFVVFAILVYSFVVSAGTTVGNAIDPCQRAAAQGVTLAGCK